MNDEQNNFLQQLLNLRENILKKIQPSLLNLAELAAMNGEDPDHRRGRASSVPASVYELGDEIITVIEIPGLQRREDLHLSVRTGSLEIRGRRFKRLPETRNQIAVLPAGTAEEFQQAVNFPCPVKPETAAAVYRHGLLEVRVKKAPQTSNDNVIIQFL
ncbi:Hsp20/alpha crystallin family protein [Desulfofundulus thermocisternus]|uniref:Hsp20/alpha crystallin family protein n=1 Tax=Desulfofundulus thermocisternus TaxID=42471 RepID=UPI0019FAAAA1|nr:Hsp20/alpha crystallin family protein [Desulfofundulus thermocisternus]MBE3585025.1 Hsp20/alpha crystallin family protein [Thermoanaerobacter sp.]MCS5694568.1 Hsp20/alpha crystallin family protein [Desulfofundulus thermocisternus]